MGRTDSNQTRRKLIKIGFADENCSGLLKQRDDERTLLRLVGESRATGGCRQASEINVVLDCEWDAIEGQFGRAKATGAGQSLRLRHDHNPHWMKRLRFDAIVNGVHDRRRRERARLIGRAQCSYR